MRIATWNVNSLRARQSHVADYLATRQPDVLALQELKMEHALFPMAAFHNVGYRSVWNGQKQSNGVAILSRSNPEDGQIGAPQFGDDPQSRVVAATYDGLRVVCAYCVNGEGADSPKFAYKLDWYRRFADYVGEQSLRYPYLAVMGDFNIAPGDVDLTEPTDYWRRNILSTDAERAIFQGFLDLGLRDAMRELHPDRRMASWFDYRSQAFEKRRGLRIDHILVSEKLRPLFKSGGVSLSMRARERPSDHAPVWLSSAEPGESAAWD